MQFPYFEIYKTIKVWRNLCWINCARLTDLSYHDPKMIGITVLGNFWHWRNKISKKFAFVIGDMRITLNTTFDLFLQLTNSFTNRFLKTDKRSLRILLLFGNDIFYCVTWKQVILWIVIINVLEFCENTCALLLLISWFFMV